jgi:hypothetical protein
MHLFKKCSNEEEAEYLTMAYNREWRIIVQFVRGSKEKVG